MTHQKPRQVHFSTSKNKPTPEQMLERKNELRVLAVSHANRDADLTESLDSLTRIKNENEET